MKPASLAIAALLAFLNASVGAQGHSQSPHTYPTLIVAAESDTMIWNGVAVSADGRIFVSGPRWTGSRGPSLALLDADAGPRAYPNDDWNAWQPS